MSSDPIREARRQWVAHGWSDAADGMAMVTSLVRALQLVTERIETALRPHGLTFSRYEVLQLLSFSSAGAMPMTRLGSLLQVHPASVTNAVDRLEQQGFVRREPGAHDRRVKLAVLTDTGREVAAAATADLNLLFADPGLPPDDVVALTALLSRLRAGSGDEVG